MCLPSWLGPTFTASLLTQWPGNWLVTPDANANTPSGVIFKKSTSSLESSLSKSADITGKTEGLILFSHTLGTCKSYVFAVKGCISGTPCIRVSLLNLSQISEVKTNRWQKVLVLKDEDLAVFQTWMTVWHCCAAVRKDK